MKKLALTAVLIFLASSGSGALFDEKGKAAVIDISGTITPSESGGLTSVSGAHPEKVRELNSKALGQGADAIIYEVNSGGGAVVASKEIYRSIESVDVPTVCRMRDVAASGGYLISLGCDRIVADRSTLTGSIGVKSSYIQFSGTLDKIGAEYINISTGGNKEIGSPFMNSTEEDREILQEKVDIIQDDFTSLTREERNLSSEKVGEISTGEPFLGEEAKSLGLVDELGGREIALEEAEKLTGEDLKSFKVEKAPEFNFLSLLTAEMPLGELIGASAPFRAEWR